MFYDDFNIKKLIIFIFFKIKNTCKNQHKLHYQVHNFFYGKYLRYLFGPLINIILRVRYLGGPFFHRKRKSIIPNRADIHSAGPQAAPCDLHSSHSKYFTTLKVMNANHIIYTLKYIEKLLCYYCVYKNLYCKLYWKYKVFALLEYNIDIQRNISGIVFFIFYFLLFILKVVYAYWI